MEDLHVRADFRQLFRILLQHAHPHAAAHHEQVKQVVVGVEAVNNLKGAVVVGHGVRVRHRGSHTPGTARGNGPAPHDISGPRKIFLFLSLPRPPVPVLSIVPHFGKISKEIF